MLKLTNSFYRYLVFTCEKVNKTHVRRFSHVNCDWKTCGRGRADIILSAQFHSSLELRQNGHGKKRLKIKIPPLGSNESKKHNLMSDQLQPSVTHASIGGHFDVSFINLVLFTALLLIIFVTTHALLSWAGDNEELQLQTGDTASSGESGRAPPNIPTDFRVWETVGDRQNRNNRPTVKFKVLSYNLLAQYLLECHPYLYTDCSPQDLKWPIRSARLFDEITSLSPDILCLQEVQSSHLETFFSSFEQIGYNKVFKKKTGRRHDGCAIFFKSSMFSLQGFAPVEFNQPELPILNRDNIGIMVKLVPHEMPNTAVVVATTHLLYNPTRTDVRLAQMQVFLAEIDRFSFFDNGTDSGHHPIILTGDFNSTPDSAVVKLLDGARVSANPYRDGSDWRRIGVTDRCQHLSVFLDRRLRRKPSSSGIKLYNSEQCQNVPQSSQNATLVDQYSGMFNRSVVSHGLNLKSVYESHLGATTFQDSWVTVDYIYFSRCAQLNLMERLRLPAEEECEVLGRLPNHKYGSDHLALAAAFELSKYRPYS